MEECDCRGAFRGAPIACGIRSMGERAKRRFERSLLFLTLGTYAWYTRAVSVRRYLAVVVLFAAGLMSKAMLVSTPIVLLLLDYWPLRRFEQSVSSDENLTASGQKLVTRLLILEKIPLIVLSTVACVITFPSSKSRYRRNPAAAVPLARRKCFHELRDLRSGKQCGRPTSRSSILIQTTLCRSAKLFSRLCSILAITAAAIVYRRGSLTS